MIICPYCSGNIYDDNTYHDVLCPHCGNLIFASTSVTYVSASGSSSRHSESAGATIITFLVLAAIAWFIFGEEAAGIVIVIGAIYLLRNVIKLLIVIGGGVVGYIVTDYAGIGGGWGALVGAIIAGIVLAKLFGD